MRTHRMTMHKVAQTFVSSMSSFIFWNVNLCKTEYRRTIRSTHHYKHSLTDSNHDMTMLDNCVAHAVQHAWQHNEVVDAYSFSDSGLGRTRIPCLRSARAIPSPEDSRRYDCARQPCFAAALPHGTASQPEAFSALTEFVRSSKTAPQHTAGRLQR
jgi:hypothetical protein